MKIKESITELVGGTPLVELAGYSRANGIPARIVGKLEYFNPAGSVKDRIALAIIEDAERKKVPDLGKKNSIGMHINIKKNL